MSNLIPLHFFQIHAPGQILPKMDVSEIFHFQNNQSGWSVFHKNRVQPFEVIVNLLTRYNVFDIIHANVVGSPVVGVQVSKNGKTWTSLGNLDTRFRAGQIKRFTIAEECQYIKFINSQASTRFPFMAIEGEAIGRVPVINLPTIRRKLRATAGFCMWPFTEVRFYEDLKFDHTRYFMNFRFHRITPKFKNSYAFNPIYSGNPSGANFRNIEDTFLAQKDNLHILAYNEPTPFIGEPEGKINDTDQLAHYVKALSIRYGKTERPEEEIVDTTFPHWDPQPNTTGLDCRIVFGINEFEGWWKTAHHRLSAKDAAALYLKCLEQNEGILVNPNATAGYGFNFWVDFGEALTPAQRRTIRAIEFHKYLYGAGDQHEGGIKAAQPPETFNFVADLIKMRQMCRFYFPNAELWLTEIGYETSGLTSASVPDIEGQHPEETQGIWLVRVLLQAMTAGIHLVTLYSISDINDPNDGLYNRCGLWTRARVEPDGISKPKLSYFIVKQFLNTFGDFQFLQLQNRNDNVFEYRFRDTKGLLAFVVYTLENNSANIRLNMPAGDYICINLISFNETIITRNSNIYVNHIPLLIFKK